MVFVCCLARTFPLVPSEGCLPLLLPLCSDGLWDNVSEEELLAEVERDVLEGQRSLLLGTVVHRHMC